MHDLVEDGSQFIVATHSPILVAFPGATILALDDGGVAQVAYDDVDHVQLYRSFLDQPERFLHHLLLDG